MGRPKLLMPFGGKTVIGCTARALKEGGADRILVVASPDNRDLQAWVRERGWKLRVNPVPSRGMLSSIQEGLLGLGGPAGLDVLLVCPADLPLLRAETVARILEARKDSHSRLTTPLYRGHRGHPLAIAGGLIEEIAGLDPAIGLRQLLLDHPEDLQQVEVDDAGSIHDLDTPQDYRRLREQIEDS